MTKGNVGIRREAAAGGHGGDGHATEGCYDATPSHKPRSHDTSRIAWAKLLARVGEEFPLECPNCGGDIRLIAFITDPGPIRKILSHLGGPAWATTRLIDFQAIEPGLETVCEEFGIEPPVFLGRLNASPRQGRDAGTYLAEAGALAFEVRSRRKKGVRSKRGVRNLFRTSSVARGVLPTLLREVSCERGFSVA